MGFREFFGLAPKPTAETEIDEARLVQPSGGAPATLAPARVKRTGYEFGIPDSGLDEYNGGVGESTQTDRRSFLQQLYESYLACPWSWASVNAIAKTITAGPLVFEWDGDSGEGDQVVPDKPEAVLACERLFKFCNPREDIRQLMRSTVSDLLVFGDAFIEVVWLAGVPVALYSLDSPSMYPIANAHGDVSGYVQVTDFQQRAEFKPHEVIHIALDSPRSGVFGVSPTQAALLPITAWLFAAATLKQVYRKGAPITIHVDMPSDMSTSEVARWEQQYNVRNLGPQNIGRPVMTRGGGAVHELGAQKIVDALETLSQKRDEIVSAYGVPPALVGIIESGNIGGGTGETQRKGFIVNTCQPLAALVLEKLDYHLAREGFGITDWHLKFEDVDMRDSKVIEDIRDMRLRNGAWTLDRYRNEIGEPPVEGGNTPVLVDRQNLVLWRDMASVSKATIARALRGTDVVLDSPDDDDAPVKLQKSSDPHPAKQIGPQPATQVSGGLQGQAAPDARPPAKPDAKAKEASDEDWQELYRERLREALAELPPSP